MPDSEAPLILSLTLDDAAQTYFNALRRQHFPARINYLAAHLTFFHHLPGAQLDTVSAQLHSLCRAQAPLPLAVTDLRSLGRGVAFTLENEELYALHYRLQQVLHPGSRRKTSKSCSRTSPSKIKWSPPRPGSC